MTVEELNHARLLCIAQMAATLEAGDRAKVVPHGDPQFDSREWTYVNRATDLFDAAEKSEAKRQIF